ncbi:MAG: TolC family protein [Lunatimonas sp.]|uniref:TolC family protein n=1 Tax=Lunatimonas sp. TaxID=2060141 RepID=UPI00263AD5FF|nr:TolC family protein [Lunatimonas sp.]MCC5935919.1 TolC family protein [Lunatimonas sp.]
MNLGALRVSSSLFLKVTMATIALLITHHLSAQDDSREIGYFDLNKRIEDQLPPLDSLIDLALINHPTVKLNEELIGSAEARVRLAKKSWSSLIRGYVDYGYGNQAIIATGPQGGDLSNIANGYRAGANLSIPLSEIYTRRDRIKLQEHELQATYFKTKEMELTITNQVIEEYNMVISSQRMMNIRYDMQQKAKSNLMQLELEYANGAIDGTAYVRNAEIYAIAQSEYESARMNFMRSIQKLEVLIGIPVIEILR